MVLESSLRTGQIGVLCILLTAQVTTAGALRQNTPRVPSSPATTPRIEQVREWAEAVLEHEPGAEDPAFYLVAGWSIAEVQELWLHIGSLLPVLDGGAVRNGFKVQSGHGREEIRYNVGEIRALTELGKSLALSPGANVFKKRAAVLHTDVAMSAPIVSVSEPSRSSRGQRGIAKLADGEQIGAGQAPAHWDLARTLLDAVTPFAAREEAARLWYRATLSFLVNSLLYDMPQFLAAADRFPDDGDIMFFMGCLREGLAGNKIQNAIGSLKLPFGTSVQVGSARTELKRAEGFFRRALRAKPDFIEARMRLGRVLGVLGEHEEAVVELRRALPTIQEPVLAYYGALFLGAEEEALGNFAVAHDLFTRAHQAYPQAQSPSLALSRLARAQGDRAEALRMLERALALANDTESIDDPWWLYNLAGGRTADELVAEMRRAFTAADSQ